MRMVDDVLTHRAMCVGERQREEKNSDPPYRVEREEWEQVHPRVLSLSCSLVFSLSPSLSISLCSSPLSLSRSIIQLLSFSLLDSHRNTPMVHLDFIRDPPFSYHVSLLPGLSLFFPRALSTVTHGHEHRTDSQAICE